MTKADLQCHDTLSSIKIYYMRQGRNQITYTVPALQQPTLQPHQNTMPIQPISHSGAPRSDFAGQLLQSLQQEKHIFSGEELALPSLHLALPCISAKVNTTVRWPPIRSSLGNIWNVSPTKHALTIPRIANFPKSCSSWSDSLDTIYTLDEDTLFLIWIVMPGTQLQEIAGAALERLGWYYDVDSSVWYLCDVQNKVLYYDTATMSRKDSLSAPPNLSKCSFYVDRLASSL